MCQFSFGVNIFSVKTVFQNGTILHCFFMHFVSSCLCFELEILLWNTCTRLLCVLGRVLFNKERLIHLNYLIKND
jgi:hypothetical protein